MTLTLSCSLNSSLQSHEHARIAEQLGYERAYFYDSPALYADVWVQLCRAAEITERIELGPGVLVPSLRHPMVTAAAIAQLVSIAGAGRVVVGVGSGFTGRMSMGQRPSKWSDIGTYIACVKDLLAGKTVSWDGGMMRMLHEEPFAPPRPIDVRWLVGAEGPKGLAVAKEHADGIISAVGTPASHTDWNAHVAFGTVLEPDEEPGSERVIEAAGHGASVFLHVAAELGIAELLPNVDEWTAAYADVPEAERHLALHEGHLYSVNDRDRPFVTPEVMQATGVALDPGQWRERVAGLEEAGITELVYQPGGPHVARELEALAEALRG